MAAKNESPFQTAFTVSVEAREGITTGISAHDRAHTIQVAIDPNARPSDLVQPGHIFPLKAKAGGVLERTGQTEAAVDLARLAGLNPSGVICEVMNDDGTMARVDDLVGYCAEHGLKMITVSDLIAYRRRHDKLVERVVETQLPTKFGEFNVVGLPLARGRQAPRGDGPRRGGRAGRRARARALRVPHRRRVPLAALRLRRAARGRAAAHPRRGPRRAALPGPGGSRHRAPQQAARLPPPGGGARHGGRQRAARAARRPARLRHRRPDPGGPRPQLDPAAHQQPEEDRGPRGLRAQGHRPGADRARRRASTTASTCARRRSAWATCSTTRGWRSTRR